MFNLTKVVVLLLTDSCSQILIYLWFGSTKLNETQRLVLKFKLLCTQQILWNLLCFEIAEDI